MTLGEVLAVKAVMKARQHFSPLLSHFAVFAAEHTQGQHDEEDQDEATSDGNGDDCRTEPYLLGGRDFL